MFLFFGVFDLDQVAAYFAAEGCVVAVEVGVEPFPDRLKAGDFSVVEEGVGFFFGLEVFFFGVERAGEECGDWG